MALKLPGNPLLFSLTQGAADAFVQQQIVTGLSSPQAYNLRGVAFQLLSNLVFAELMNVQVAITRRSKAAMPNISDPDVIFLFDAQVRVNTAVGFSQWTHRYLYFVIPQEEQPIVEEILYAQLDSNATGLANSVALRLDVDLDTMSDLNRLNLITRSLA